MQVYLNLVYVLNSCELYLKCTKNNSRDCLSSTYSAPKFYFSDLPVFIAIMVVIWRSINGPSGTTLCVDHKRTFDPKWVSLPACSLQTAI